MTTGETLFFNQQDYQKFNRFNEESNLKELSRGISMSEVESINPNTPITSNLTTEGKIETTSTGGPLSFDELEEVTMATKKAKTEKKESKPQEKSKDLTSDTDKGKSPQAKTEKEAAGKDNTKSRAKNDSNDGEEDALTPAQARKLIKAKFQDSEIDLDEEALIPVKVNGKEELVPVRDLMGNYSGKTAWDKKFTELDRFRKQMSGEREQIGQIKSALESILSESDPEMKITRIAEFAGLDPITYRQQFYQDMYPLLEKQLIMSEDERRAADLAFEAKIHKQRADTYESQIRRQEADVKLSNELEGLMASHKIVPSELVSKYDEMDILVKLGKLSPEQVTAQNMAVEIVKDRYTLAAAQKLNELNLYSDKGTRFKKAQELMIEALTNGDSIEDMIAQMEEVAGFKKSRRLEEKKKSRDEFVSGKRPVTQTRGLSEEPIFFDEI